MANMASIVGNAVSTVIEQCKRIDCKKATNWELKEAGIDPHEYKTEHGAIPWSRYDICKCKDGLFRIAQVGQCGKTNDYWW